MHRFSLSTMLLLFACAEHIPRSAADTADMQHGFASQLTQTGILPADMVGLWDAVSLEPARHDQMVALPQGDTSASLIITSEHLLVLSQRGVDFDGAPDVECFQGTHFFPTEPRFDFILSGGWALDSADHWCPTLQIVCEAVHPGDLLTCDVWQIDDKQESAPPRQDTLLRYTFDWTREEI